MNTVFSPSFRENIIKNVDFIKECASHRPRWAVVLGSGFSRVASYVSRKSIFPYRMLWGMPRTAVKGHEPVLILGCLRETPVAMFCGRPHGYEGFSGEETVMHVALSAGLGIRKLFLTNAAGGLNPRFSSGDLMVISDHINLTPEISKPAFGAEKMKNALDAYDEEMRSEFKAICTSRGVRCGAGVYAGLSGPSYETHAEIEHLKRIGADAVGMSTVNEALAAKELGMKVIAVSCISNSCHSHSDTGVDHNSVIEAVDKAVDDFAGVLSVFLT